MPKRPCVFCQGEVETPANPVRALESFPAKLRATVRGLAPDALAWRPSPREWTMKEIARHLGDVEMVYGVRFRAMLAEEDPLLLTLDQERWAAGLGYVKDNLADALDLFAALRRWNVLIVKRAGPKNWERGGRHARYGRVTVRQLLDHVVHHDTSHLKQILSVKSTLPRGGRKRRRS